MAATIDASKYAHSPVHAAVIAGNHDALRREIDALPSLSDPSTIHTEAASLAEEASADAISAVIDRRDVPNRETPLHLAVRLSDLAAVDLLMSAGADWTLQNSQGWSALQDAICAREEALARAIVRRSHPLTWAKWRRRLPRVIAVMRRMRDFYMEIAFHFESSVIPFVSRIAPSDTYRIWKRGANLRADMTLAGFDGFKIQRSDQTVLFLGEGSEDGKVQPGSLCIISHKNREVMNALDGAGAPATEKEIQHEVSSMMKTNIMRPEMDVTKAVLLPQMTWRRQERKDAVGPWKAKVYEMHHVTVTVKSRLVPGATAKDNAASSDGNESRVGSADFADVLTEEEQKQLEAALKMESPDIPSEGTSDEYTGQRHSSFEQSDILNMGTGEQDRGNGGENQKNGRNKKKIAGSRNSLSVDGKVSNLLGESPPHFESTPGRPPVEATRKKEDSKGARSWSSKRSSTSSEKGSRRKADGKDGGNKKSLKPVLWLSPNFPLKTDELLPMLDILANKVKAIRRLRELLTTKLPPGTFPVKVAIPIVPTIRVLVTFTKFEELQPLEEFSTPPSSPDWNSAQPSTSWRHWLKGTSSANYSQMTAATSGEDIQDPFIIPPDYAWITPEAKKKRRIEKRRNANKASKAKVQNK